MSIVEIIKQGIYMFMGFIMGIAYGTTIALTGLTSLTSPFILGFLFVMTLVGIFFGWGILKKDKIEQRRDIK